METKLQEARSLKSERRYSEAADVYREALRIAPTVGGLYAEAAEVELLSGDPEKAAEHAEKALELEPASVDLFRLRGDALRAAGDIELAVEAYEKARGLRPEDASLAALVDEVRRELERESLPSEYLAISRTERVTREQLAALLFIRLRSVVENAEKRVPFIATDVADSWAREFIRQVVATEILDVFPNHTFQPQAFVRRGDLAVALTALWDSAPATQNVDSLPEPAIQDVSPENLNYRSLALVVSLDLLPLEDGGRFEPLRFVDGQEAVDAVDALAKRMTP
jgi:tetratricopeptide (TPR) repeat protein